MTETGFKVESIRMRDCATKKVFFQEQGWETIKPLREMHLEKALLECESVATEYTFSVDTELEDLKLVQQMLMMGNVIEEFKFEFGFAMPGSTNSFESIIYSAGKGNMYPPELLSGNLQTIVTFVDGDKVVGEKISPRRKTVPDMQEKQDELTK
ncbi:putative Retinal rod rhodopsin-sensitive cGMP 3',5'-cyclic phosphodiesterase subunit delta [Blattamonas nauphoetae]|uniref:Retinal rod rhodopsin-sensitive cGMP 3',5'-cyclic phosphodiesterase subunit delta n=1 Tax=Blattamonas nauphoetae TaxID=2049346 RepID=A0ABQ9X0E1_9EUKA|nr:putative Retinal rod rhodopsin-sensitive cGMP 3',5'-cyclic phosphodiesterase subunit delta [Blattamonas nauphoetae]